MYEEIKPKMTDKKIRILEAAIELYSKGEVFSITTRMIAAKAGVANGLVNYHYPDTKKIFWSCIEYIYQTVVPQIHLEIKGDEPVERIQSAIRANFKFFVEKYPKYYSCILLSYYLATCDQDMRDLHVDLYEASIGRLSELISKAGKEKKEARALAVSIWNEMEGGLLFSSIAPQSAKLSWTQNQLDSIENKLNKSTM